MLAGDTVLAAFDASADGRRAISVRELRGGRRSSAVAVPGSEGGSYPQIVRVSDGSIAVVAYTLGGDARRELRLARIAVSGAKE